MKSLSYSNKHIYIAFIIFLIFTFFSIKSYAETVSKDLSSSVFRLHVIANSDSFEDQQLKFKVRDSLINYMKELTIDSNTKNQAVEISKSHINDLKEIAQKVVLDNGYNYSVDIEIGNYFFPTKNYGDVFLPLGNYDALKVKIGESHGHNWWCVMFPPLCFVDITTATVPEESKQFLKDNLSDDEYSLILQNTSSSEFKFKIVEIYNNLSTKIAKKNY